MLDKLLIIALVPFCIDASQVIAAPAAVQAYAAQCDKEIGVTVPDFECDDGMVVPTTIRGEKFEFGVGSFQNPRLCDRPNVLNGSCDAGSKFLVISNSPDAYVIAHCRRIGQAAGMYQDVAIIQHNKITGATCFYQNQLQRGLKGFVRAPINQTTDDIQKMRAGPDCVGCHDNGPVIRSPYLAQMKNMPDNIHSHVVPGAGDSAFNNDRLQGDPLASKVKRPYFLVGAESTKTYAVNVKDVDSNANGSPRNLNPCTSCHTLSVHDSGPNTVIQRDSAVRFATISTAREQSSKMPHSSTSPKWMSPETFAFSSVDAAAALEIATCANQFTTTENYFSAPLQGNSTRLCEVTAKTGRIQKPMSIISSLGKCMDLVGDDWASDSPNGRIVAYSCSGVSGSNQKWTVDHNSGEISIVHGRVKRCLSAERSVFDGMAVSTRVCDNSDFQKWNYTEASGKFTNRYVDSVTASGPKKCLDLFGGLAEEAAIIGLWQCGQGIDDNQSWAIQDLAYKTIESFVRSDLSITVENGQPQVSQVESSSPIFHWNLERFQGGSTGQPDYRIRHHGTNEFLNIDSGSLTVGPIQAYLASARWVLRNRPEAGADVYTIQNVWKPEQFLVLRKGKVESAVVSEADPATRWKLKLIQD